MHGLGNSQARVAQTIHTMNMFGIACAYQTRCMMHDVTDKQILSSSKIWSCFSPSQKHWPIWIAVPFLGCKKKHTLKPPTSYSRSNSAASPF